jgi:hypothetical protein
MHTWKVCLPHNPTVLIPTVYGIALINKQEAAGLLPTSRLNNMAASC